MTFNKRQTRPQFVNYTVRTKLIIILLAVALIPLGILSYFNNLSTKRSLTGAADQALYAVALQTATSLDRFIQTNLNAISAETQLPVLAEILKLPPGQRRGSAVEKEALALLQALSQKDPNISSYALLDGQGLDVIDTFVSDVGADKSDRPYFDYFQTAGVTDKAYMSPVVFSESANGAVLYFSSPVHNATGESIGVLRARYSADVLQGLLAEKNDQAGEESFGVLFDEYHIHLAHGIQPHVNFIPIARLDSATVADLKASKRLPDLPDEEIFSMQLDDLKEHLSHPDRDRFFEATDIATGDTINRVAIAKLETQPWLVTFFQPQEIFLRPAKDQARDALLFAMLIIAVVAILAVFVGQQWGDPLTRLAEVARQVSEGDLNVEAPVQTNDEIGLLAITFNIMTDRLRRLVGSLEEQVQERTADLILSMRVGQQAAAIKELDSLLPTITEFIREQFDLYYVQVYFIDDLGQELILRAGTGRVGKELLAHHHSLFIADEAIVSRVASEAQAIVVPNTKESKIHKPNPRLPDTRSELAVPLIVEEQVIGVLDMQNNEVNTFTVSNVPVFEAMGTQLAIAIQSAQQWAAAQAAQQRAEAAIKRLTRETWADRLYNTKKVLGFAYDLSSITPLEEKAQNGLSVPVVVQNEAIGQLSIEPSTTKGRHEGHEDEQALLAAVAEQLAQKAENLRLFEQTQQRAIREHITRQVIEKVRGSRDIETALRTAAEELSKALGTARAVIELKVDSQDGQGEI